MRNIFIFLKNLADAAQVLKPYISYINSYVENICNTSNEQEVVQLARYLIILLFFNLFSQLINSDLKSLGK